MLLIMYNFEQVKCLYLKIANIKANPGIISLLSKSKYVDNILKCMSDPSELLYINV